MSNPAVTFRISPADLERLERIEWTTGKSRGQLLRETLGIVAREVDSAYASGFDDGLQAGRIRGIEEAAFRLRVPCSSCKKYFDLDFTSDKAGPTYWRLVRNVIQNEGWHHGKCP